MAHPQLPPTTFFIGGYGAPGQETVQLCALGAQGDLSRLAGCDGLHNPSWLLPHPALPVLYAVEELSPEGYLTALTPVGGALVRSATLPTGGADPCHIAISPAGRHLFVSNYSGGSVAVFELNENGLPARRTDFRQHRREGQLPAGAQPDRQEAAHVHSAHCDGERVYVCDLGLDAVFIYGWDEASGRLSASPELLPLPAGSGPRHLSFDASHQRLYVICELSAQVFAFARVRQGWREIQRLSVVPEGTPMAGVTAAAIHWLGEGALMASARGCDLLIRLEVGEDGALSAPVFYPAGGRTPRDFMPAGEALLAAYQDGGAVGIFEWEGTSLHPLSAHPAQRPTCLCPATEALIHQLT